MCREKAKRGSWDIVLPKEDATHGSVKMTRDSTSSDWQQDRLYVAGSARISPISVPSEGCSKSSARGECPSTSQDLSASSYRLENLVNTIRMCTE